jgi:hypothetical protein
METISVGIDFDENTLRAIGRKYKTEVLATDYVDHMDVYSGPLNQDFFNMIKFYFENHWLDGVTWIKYESPLRNGWTKLVIEAEDSKGYEELFNISVTIKDRLDLSRVGQRPNGSWEAFFWGFLAGLFPTKKALEIIGAGFLLNLFKK